MKRFALIIMTAMLTLALCACSTASAATPDEEPGAAAAVELTPVPTEPPAPLELILDDAPEGWADVYLRYLDDNYDIFAALWPEGLSGIGFIDLDLDSMPEMIVFDLGASATLGAQIFDCADGEVYCVSSVLDAAAGAFGDEHFSKISVCTSYFESFRLSLTADGYVFWVNSANGTMESSWDEIVRFDSDDSGIVIPVSVCARYLQSDADSGVVITERYTVDGAESDAEGYAAAAAVYMNAGDMGYDAKGVFLWNDMTAYDTTYEGFMAMARDAAEAYVPIAVS